MLLNLQSLWFCITSTGKMHMPLLWAVTLCYDYQQNYFWISLLPTDIHSPLWQGKPHGLHGCALNQRPTTRQCWVGGGIRRKTKSQQTILSLDSRYGHIWGGINFQKRHIKTWLWGTGVFGDLPLAEEQQGISEEWSNLLYHITRLWQSWDLSSLYSWKSYTTSLFYTQHWRLILLWKKDVLGVQHSEDWQLWEETDFKTTFWTICLIPTVIKNCSNKIKTHMYQ